MEQEDDNLKEFLLNSVMRRKMMQALKMKLLSKFC